MTGSSRASAATGSDDRVTVRDLAGVPRAAFVLVGLAALTAGGFAVFKSSNQAGTVALIAVGAIASLLAVAGKLPLRWVIGGHEFDMSHRAARAAAEVVASHLPPSETAELAGQLASVEGGRFSLMTGAMLDHVNFERSAISRVAAVVQEQGWSYVDGSASDRGTDGFVETPDGRRVPVEYKLMRNREQLGRRIRELRQRYRASGIGNAVIVVSGPPLTPDSRLAQTLQSYDSPRLCFVFLDDPEFEHNLAAAVEAALVVD